MMEWIRKNDVFTKALSVACAILMWSYVMGSTDHELKETYSRIIVDFTGMDSLTQNDLLITSGTPAAVSFTLYGQGDKLTMVDEDSITATADLSSITSPGTYNIKYQVNTNVDGVTIKKITQTLPIVVERITSKPVPVELNLTGALPEGYILDKRTLRPDAVTVTGPEITLNKIVKAVASYDISELKETSEATLSYKLVDSEGDEVTSSFLSVNTSAVQATLDVRQTGEIPFVLKTNNYGFITEELFEISIDPPSVKINGDPEVVSTLNHIDVGNVNLETIVRSGLFEFELPVILPNGVTSEQNISSVKVKVEPVGIKKIELIIDKEALPESADFKYVSDIVVNGWTVEGREDELGAASVDIQLSYEPEELVSGLNEIPAKIISLDDQFLVVGTYTVVVEVP